MGGGNGVHLGAMLTVLLPVPLIDVTLDSRLEYRIMQAGYIPEYFDQTYDLGRFNYACSSVGCFNGYAPKSAALRLLKDDPNSGNQGYYGELAFNFGGCWSKCRPPCAATRACLRRRRWRPCRSSRRPRPS